MDKAKLREWEDDVLDARVFTHTPLFFSNRTTQGGVFCPTKKGVGVFAALEKHSRDPCESHVIEIP
jgi:hypothetical protein